jgi:adenosylcobyric acid synthase
MPGLTIMVQGTGSHVGKSTLVTALCRIFRQDGYRVAPFKAQNMANNAHVCLDGGEIGRAQAVQAEACGIEPTIDMNPVLLKPCTDVGSQVVVRGKVVKTMNARDYQAFKPSLIPTVRESIDRLRAEYDVVVIEGAGSPAEINLRGSDIVNMRTAALADAPVILVGDIDFGGVFAQLVGTMHLLLDDERARIRGFVINKFRGDIEILKPGLDYLEKETGRKVLGVLPYYKNIRIAEEDTVPSEKIGARPRDGKIRIDVIKHPRIANFTDFDALEAEPDVSLRYLEQPDGEMPDAFILPGTKSTIADLRKLKSAGFVGELARALEGGSTVVGICGGFQMLGTKIFDPHHVESDADVEEGLGLLPSVTVFCEKKQTSQVKAVHLPSGAEISGYEIHMGCTQGNPSPEPLFKIQERFGFAADGYDGMSARGGKVWGTYLHGLFESAPFRRHFIDHLRAARGMEPLAAGAVLSPSTEIDKLAALVRANLDLPHLYKILRREA